MTTSAYGVQRTAATVQPAVAQTPLVVTRSGVRTRSPLAATSATILAALLLAFAAYVGVVGTVVHARAQQLAYATFREQLANGTAPLGQIAAGGEPVPLGAPIALLDAPGIHEVIRQGTTAGVLTGGAGHRRDTPLPGQPGTSLVYGRAAAFGGPFAGLGGLQRGTRLTITTGQGKHTYTVTGVRRAGDPLPPASASRVTFVTASGPAFLPSGALRVDADLTSPVLPMAPLRPVALTDAERPLAGDRSALFGLVLWGQALVGAACLVVWMTVRWGRRQAWLVGVPLLAALGVAVAASAAQLLPNLT